MKDTITKAFEPQAPEPSKEKEYLAEAVEILKSIHPKYLGLFTKGRIDKLIERINDESI